MDLSVIIVTRNTRAFTSAAVRSVAESSDNFRKEVIVVDNGSTDGTLEEIRQQFPATQCIRSEINLGFAGANNLGARRATGDFILLLNSDARLKPDSLAKAVGWMRQNQSCGVAGAQLLNPDGTRQNSIANFPALATELLNKSLLRRMFPAHYPGKEQHFTGPREVESVIGAFFLVPRSLWEKLGGFDERYFFFFEETDFCLQVRRVGLKVMHLPGVEVWHEQGKSAQQWSLGARIEYWRSRYSYFQKNHGALTGVVMRAGLLLRLIVELLTASLMAMLTFGRSERWRHKRSTYWGLTRWHLLGRPAEMGLPR